MRTIDPFLAPGLWGGPPKPPQSPMTAGRARPPRRPAVIAALPEIAHAPLASLAGSVLGPRFHAWYGRSRRRYVCSVFAVGETDAMMGLPDFNRAAVIAAGRDGGQLHALHIFALDETKEQNKHVGTAVAAGAVEWHIYLPFGDDKELRDVLLDLDA